jgi:hypothetical protein
MTSPRLLGLEQEAESPGWIDADGDIHQSETSYYLALVELPDRNETLRIPVPTTGVPLDRLRAIMDALTP